MNDRFKFRVWAKPDEKTDTEGYYVDDADYMVMHPDGTAEITYCVDDGYAGQIVHFEQDEIIVEQCTGLKDKNGKLIYEGDFLDYKGEVCLVFWSEPTACFGVMLQDSGYTDYAGDIKRSDLYSIDADIIGNIHENPELLKESK